MCHGYKVAAQEEFYFIILEFMPFQRNGVYFVREGIKGYIPFHSKGENGYLEIDAEPTERQNIPAISLIAQVSGRLLASSMQIYR